MKLALLASLLTFSDSWSYAGPAKVHRIMDVQYGVVCYVAIIEEANVKVPSMQCLKVTDGQVKTK